VITVKWMQRGNNDPVKVESTALKDLNRIVFHCRKDLPTIRLNHALMPPDGFIVMQDGEEVRRWFETPFREDGIPT
jgi:hypothetical protein